MRRSTSNAFTPADVDVHLGQLGDIENDPIDATVTLHNRRGPQAAAYASFTARSIQYTQMLLDRLDDAERVVDEAQYAECERDDCDSDDPCNSCEARRAANVYRQRYPRLVNSRKAAR